MNWPPPDQRSQTAARNFPLPIQKQKIPQVNGPRFNRENWEEDTLQAGDDWTPPPYHGGWQTAPENIIAEFQRGHRLGRYLPALALTVCWGTMWRTDPHVYGNRNLWTINNKLQQCAQSIQETESIADAWELLTSPPTVGLEWTSVMASKTLHFLCRALGSNQDPPVAIDSIIRDRVWWAFRGGIIPFNRRPEDWGSNDDHSFRAYCRYMTVIQTWAQMWGWTTTEMEATIYGQYKD